MSLNLQWLQDVTVSAIPLRTINKEKRVIVLNSKINLETALQTLVSHDILSAPVWEEESNSFVGNLDMRDIVNMIAITCKKHDVFESKKLSQLLGEEIFVERSIKEVFSIIPFFFHYYLTSFLFLCFNF